MHGHEAGGVNAAALVVAVPLVVLGVILFFQKSAAPIVSVVLVSVGLIVAIGSFTFLSEDSDEGHAAATEPASSYQTAVDALCEARDAGAAEASDLFFDRAHGPLHVLADDVADEDRKATATLLEAKQEVEASLDAGSDTLHRDFERLIDATVSALSVADVEVEACA